MGMDLEKMIKWLQNDYRSDMIMVNNSDTNIATH